MEQENLLQQILLQQQEINSVKEKLSSLKKSVEDLYYKIILDEDKLKDFIDWLPELKSNEVYFVALFARKKYCAENDMITSNETIIKRFSSKKDYLFNKIKQLETEFGSYSQKNDKPMPQQSLALYINPNPRCLEKSAKNSLKKLADLITQPYNGYNPHTEILSQIQVSSSNKIFMDFDFDHVEYDFLKSEVEKYINPLAVNYVQTKGGFHVLIKLKEVEKQFTKTWFQNISKIKGCDFSGDKLLPVPGCTQGNFIPKLIY